MADPKYANLPGIAYDQPDVYETSDLPEVDQATFDIGDESESIDRINISGSDAYNKFKGTKLDSSNADFSDRISRERRIGYNIPSGEYEMAEEGSENETVLQKYQRLQHEMRSLMEEVEQIQKTAKTEKGTEKQSSVLSVKQVEQIEKQLLEVRLEQMLASDVIASLTDPQASLQKKLLSQVEKLKGSPSAAVTKTAKKQAKDDKMVYELHFKPEQSKFLQSAKVAEFEQRMQKLEDVVGHEPEKMRLLASDTNHKSLLGAITVLNSKMNLLDSEQLDQIEMRLQVLSQKLSQISEKKTALENADKENKVSEAFDMLKKIEHLKTALPEVVDRMIALQQLHEQALQFSKSLTQVDVAQQQVQSCLQDNHKLLREVKENFTKNLDTINKNITTLDARVAALKKK